MAFIFGWLIFSVGVGAIAQIRGRNLFLWALLAGMISPIIAFIVLFVMDDKSEEDPNTDSPINRGIGVEEFTSRIEEFKDLYVEDMLTEEELSIKKKELINDLGRGGIDEPEGKFLKEVKDLRDDKVINESDVEKLKSLVL
jgi:hypothetical protein